MILKVFANLNGSMILWLYKIYCTNKYSPFIWMILNMRAIDLKTAHEILIKFVPTMGKIFEIVWNLL